jgi:hypothetical protein
MSRFRIRTILIIVATIAALLCVTLRIYHSVVPRGASPLPYLLASVAGGTIESPNGKKYDIWFNDAGAAHSGAHWTWIVSTHPVFGKSVVAEGYLGSEYAVEKSPVPVSWDGDNPVVDFRSSRYGD